MSVLAWIILACVAGAVLSVVAAAAVTLTPAKRWLPGLVSYAVGALLGAAFMDVLPEAIETASSPAVAMAWVLGGILLFFLLEKLVLWRHCHDEHCEPHAHAQPAAPAEHPYTHARPHSHAHGHSHGEERSRSGALILIGDTFHNFVDGVLIAAAFMQSVPLGMVTALAIIAHEIPQEVGDFAILLHSGYSRAKAFLFNLLSSLATLVGAILAYCLLSQVQSWVPAILALAAASMIYVAVADLIPGLHKRAELPATLQQVLWIAAGLGSILLAHALVAHAH